MQIDNDNLLKIAAAFIVKDAMEKAAFGGLVGTAVNMGGGILGMLKNILFGQGGAPKGASMGDIMKEVKDYREYMRPQQPRRSIFSTATTNPVQPQQGGYETLYRRA
jgi:hypothetical protein